MLEGVYSLYTYSSTKFIRCVHTVSTPMLTAVYMYTPLLLTRASYEGTYYMSFIFE